MLSLASVVMKLGVYLEEDKFSFQFKPGQTNVKFHHQLLHTRFYIQISVILNLLTTKKIKICIALGTALGKKGL